MESSSSLVIASLEDAVARRTGLRRGERIVRVNGAPVRDELDFRFRTAGNPATLDVIAALRGDVRRVAVTEDQCRGLVFEPMRIRRCGNRCLFCFVDQLPPGLRGSLYVRDEDVRFSFLYGNYVTLASVTDQEMDRIRRMRMTPLYVSVHATDPAVRNRLLGRKRSREILGTIEALTRSGITLHAQVVLCPGINDGEVLERTVRDLARFRPFLASLAVVPVGLTRFRRANGLPVLRAVGRRDAARIVASVGRWNAQVAGHGRVPEPFVMLADEFYHKAGAGFPPLRRYGDLPQLENGVGMIPRFLHDWERSRKRRRRVIAEAGSRTPYVVATGELAAPYVVPYVRCVSARTGVRLEPIVVRNRFLGPRVTVTGLITGRDLLAQLRGRVRRAAGVLLPDVMLNRASGLLLDDVSLKDLEKDLGSPVASFPSDPAGFEKFLRKNLPGRPAKKKH